MTRARLPLAQGGAGLYVDFGGLANLDGCNVFSNEAQVRAARALRPFPELSSSAPMERYVLDFWLAGRRTIYRRQGNSDQHQRVLESGRYGALTFCPCLDMSSIGPDGTLRAPLFGLQGAGVIVYGDGQRNGVAHFVSCNIHDNTAVWVILHL